MMGISDGFALTVAVALGGFLRWWIFGLPLIPAWSWLMIVVWWVVAYNSQLLPGWGIGIVDELRRVFYQLSLLFGGTTVVLFLTQDAGMTSRFTLVVGYLASIPLVPFVRTIVKKTLIARDLWGVPTVVYGSGDTGHRVVDALKEDAGLGYRLVGMFDDDPEIWGDAYEDIPILGSTNQSISQAAVAILAMPHAPRQRIQEMLEGPLSHYRQVVIIPDLIDMPTLWVKSRDLAGIMGLEIASRLLDPVARFTKRAADLLFTILFAPFWVPLFGLVAAAIWLEDRHDPFFLQERIGEGDRPFFVRKFRTMVHNAEDVLERRLQEDPELKAEWQANFKLKDDPRITRVGRLLRKLSLDEIPQLINVLKGEMSLVGPRPLPRYHLDELPHRVRDLRARVRPGMTGMWQISGRSDTGNDGMVRWDAFYVQNWSAWLDMVILVRTLRVVFRGEGAY
jgi:Undecaprenyl-phosphate galactose phosphotransferase WbaP